jgi:hypothetical protein
MASKTRKQSSGACVFPPHQQLFAFDGRIGVNNYMSNITGLVVFLVQTVASF